MLIRHMKLSGNPIRAGVQFTLNFNKYPLICKGILEIANETGMESSAPDCPLPALKPAKNYRHCDEKIFQLPGWSTRIKAPKILRLYESDAIGLLDTHLLDDVGWALYSRCDSFLESNRARGGQDSTPARRETQLAAGTPKELLHCAACGWECTYRAYMDSIKNQQLDGGPEVIALFQQYVDTFPRAKEPSEKMLAVDRLIHGFHHFLRSGRTRRLVGINLIDVHLEFVIDFLNHLTYGPGSTPGVYQTYEMWHEKVSAPGHKKSQNDPV